jgi:F-type H+-transporting ATPase subunit b
MDISWWTVALQSLNFLVLVWILERLLYRPIRQVLERRRQQAAEVREKSAQATAAAEAERSAYERKVAALEKERDQALDKARRDAAEERMELLDRARRESAALLSAARGELAEERKAARTAVRRETADLALRIASRLLAELGAKVVCEAFLERIEGRVEAQPPEEREAFAAELAREPRLVVASEPAIDEETGARWRARLRSRFGESVRVDFVRDVSLVAGVELRFPKSVVQLSFRDTLAGIGRELESDAHADR